MKVLFLINELGKGGAERVISSLLLYLTQSNSDYKFYLYLLEDAGEGYPIPESVNLLSDHKKPPSNFFKFIYLPLHAIRVRKKVNKFEIDIILSFLNRANYVNTLSKVFGAKHKCLISERNTASLVYESSSLIDKANRLLIKILYPKSNLIIAISKGVKRDLIENFNIGKDKIVVIYNPVDIKTINNKASEYIKHSWLDDNSIYTLISIGRLEKQKNQKLLIKAFRIVNQNFPNTRLLILGEGSQRCQLQQLVVELNLNSFIELPGITDNPFAYLSRADVFVLSSSFEGFGNVIVEAMVCKCPVVSTDCLSGPSEIINHGKNGILVPVDNVEKLSASIIKLIEDKSYTGSLIRMASKRALDFRLEEIASQYKSLLV
jgi:N-acetylgalactosamine-N,N'-diacetylbacillosaminyl-diphospho-undecaprenol 4-alpha-N-acetylgalactosaminyltransferase